MMHYILELILFKRMKYFATVNRTLINKLLAWVYCMYIYVLSFLFWLKKMKYFG